MSGAPRVAAIVLLRADGAALLQHRDDIPGIPHPGKWTPPGGHCETDESMEACARRELFEETSYRAADPHLLTEFVDDNAAGFQSLRLCVFWGRYDGTQSVVCHEGQALAFIPREEAGAYPIPAYLVDLWDLALDTARGAEVRP